MTLCSPPPLLALYIRVLKQPTKLSVSVFWSLHQAPPLTSQHVCVQCQHAPEHVVHLLRAAVEPQLDLAVRQQAAITFKHLCKNEWDDEGAISVGSCMILKPEVRQWRLLSSAAATPVLCPYHLSVNHLR